MGTVVEVMKPTKMYQLGTRKKKMQLITSAPATLGQGMPHGFMRWNAGGGQPGTLRP